MKNTADTKKATPSPAPVRAGTVQTALDAVGRTTAHTVQRTELGDGTDTVLTVEATGDFDFAADRGTLGVDATSGLSGEVVARTEEVFTEDEVYLRTAAAGEQSSWAFIGRDDIAAHRMLRAPANDPEYILRQAAMSEKYFRLLGKAAKAEVDGVPTTHYRALLSDDALTLRMTEEARDQAETMRVGMGGRIPAFVDVWVDHEGRAVQVQLALRIEDTLSSVTTLTLTELGRPVDVDVPSAEDGAGSAEVDELLLG